MKSLLTTLCLIVLSLSSSMAATISGTAWQLDSQIPPAEALMKLQMKRMGFPDEMIEVMDFKVGQTVLIIKDYEMVWKTIVDGADDTNTMDFRLNGDKLELNQDAALGLADNVPNEFVEVIKDFTPNYYSYALEESKLVLTTDPIKGLDGQKITYYLSKFEGE